VLLLALYQALPQLETMDELVGLLSNMLHQLVLGLSRKKPRHRTIQQMTRMIKEQLTDNLSLAHFADKLFVSASYLSSLFKLEMGINFIDYMHQKRIERAGTRCFPAKQQRKKSWTENKSFFRPTFYFRDLLDCPIMRLTTFF
jgi:YesN/AraC family two-component response regulator